MIYDVNLLSVREKEVFEQIQKGYTNPEIAKQLFISEKTIKFHCTNIYRKLCINGRRSFFINSLNVEGL
ncbi:hypothetical protein CJF42_23060 [Pseudoalteromonas sp. NBT06-2]|uniref:helix-turn-helix domain-containing protein n=1 Tax=Pseudoalteromonas sp. NBT06-2 TaxID=2025950 RepID=UPI000BA5E7DE|nr:helix-turn-helix transcriptional regulator [Pseudoalteromonas sp. NBT06-2]PAJ72104.1 hypothetical protein CJF42_23060 [Pseudoalteromonas sp. NBT06-2]